jgi:hypothetical protein
MRGEERLTAARRRRSTRVAVWPLVLGQNGQSDCTVRALNCVAAFECCCARVRHVFIGMDNGFVSMQQIEAAACRDVP